MSNYTKTEGGNEVDILTDYAKTSDVSSTYATKAYVYTLGILSTVNLASNVTGILPITKGGTGKTTNAEALAALGGLSSVDLSSNVVTGTLPIANGGTGKTNKAEALAALGGLSSVNLASNVTGILPIANGGTGIDAIDAINNIGIYRRILQFSTNTTYNLIYEGSQNESITGVNWNTIYYDGGGTDSVKFTYNSTRISDNSIIVATYIYQDDSNTTGVTVKLYNQINGHVSVNLMAPDFHAKFPNNGGGKHRLYMIIINN